MICVYTDKNKQTTKISKVAKTKLNKWGKKKQNGKKVQAEKANQKKQR